MRSEDFMGGQDWPRVCGYLQVDLLGHSPRLPTLTLVEVAVLSSLVFIPSGYSASPSSALSEQPPSTSRPKRSLVWDYVSYDAESNKSVCQIESSGSVSSR